MRTVPSILLSLAAAATLMAAAPAQAEMKIGVIRTQTILRDAPQKKSAEARFKAEFDKREKDLETERNKFQDDVKKYQRDADTMSAQQRANAEKDLNTRKIDLDLKQRQFSEDAQGRNQELMRNIYEQVNQAIADVAKEGGFDLILQDPAFAAPALDITDAVVKKLTAAAAAAPAADTKKKKK